jgi:hypothetical protein
MGPGQHRNIPALNHSDLRPARRQFAKNREPGSPYQIAIDRYWLLQILSGKEKAANFRLNPLERLTVLALGVKEVAALAVMLPALTNRNNLVLGCDGSKIKVLQAIASMCQLCE